MKDLRISKNFWIKTCSIEVLKQSLVQAWADNNWYSVTDNCEAAK